MGRLASDGQVCAFARQSTLVGSISVTATATAFNTSSDRRLKKEIADFTASGAIIDQLRPRPFRWEVNNHLGVGFIADELQEAFPEAVIGQQGAVVAVGVATSPDEDQQIEDVTASETPSGWTWV